LVEEKAKEKKRFLKGLWHLKKCEKFITYLFTVLGFKWGFKLKQSVGNL